MKSETVYKHQQIKNQEKKTGLPCSAEWKEGEDLSEQTDIYLHFKTLERTFFNTSLPTCV